MLIDIIFQFKLCLISRTTLRQLLVPENRRLAIYSAGGSCFLLGNLDREHGLWMFQLLGTLTWPTRGLLSSSGLVKDSKTPSTPAPWCAACTVIKLNSLDF